MLNKRIISLILALLMLLTTSFTALAFEPASYDAGDEMFVDGGIESASYAFSTNNGNLIGYTQDGNYVHSGSRALRFTGAGGDIMARHGRTEGTDEMNAYFKEGVIYKLSFWAKADSGSTTFTFPGTAADNAYGTGFLKDVTTGADPYAVVGSEWKKVELYIKPGTGTTITSGLQYFRIQSSQPASLDELSLKPVSIYPEFTGVAEAETNLIGDPSMEAQKPTALAGGGWESSYVEVADAPSGHIVLKTVGSATAWMQAHETWLFKGGWEVGATYSFSFWAKTETDTTGSLFVSSERYGGGALIINTSISNQWQKYTSIFTITDATQVSNNCLNFVPSGTILFDDMNLIKLSDTMDLLNSSIESQKACLPYDVDSASFTTSTLIDASTLSTITIDNGGSVTATIDEYGYKFNVSFDTIETGTTYTLDLTGVKDIYGQALTTFIFQVEGYKADDPMIPFDLIVDPSLDDMTSISVLDLSTVSIEDYDGKGKVIKAIAAANDDGSFGGKHMYMQATTADTNFLKYHPYEAGKSYFVSFMAKTESGSVDLTVSSARYLGGEKFYTRVTNQWEKHTGVFTFDSNYTGDLTSISFYFPSISTVYFDEVHIYELVDMKVVETSLGENTTNVALDTDTIEIVMPYEIDSTSINDVSFTTDKIGFEVESSANVLLIKNITGLADNTQYTIDLSSVKDSYGQNIATASSQFMFRTIGYIDIAPIVFNVASVAAGEITATTTISNSSADKTENIALVLISYTSDGYIENINISHFEVGAGATQEFVSRVTATSSTENVIAYVWDWNNLAPWQKEITLGK